MPKLPLCDRCLLCAREPFLVCAIHPYGPDGDTCLDFRPNPELENKHFVDFLGLGEREDDVAYSNPYQQDPDEEQWEPIGASYYNGELILQLQQRWTREEQLELLDWHPMFTGRCPHCERPFPKYVKPPVHWDCECGWMDDTV